MPIAGAGDMAEAGVQICKSKSTSGGQECTREQYPARSPSWWFIKKV